MLTGMTMRDLGGTLYMADGRVIDRAAGQSEVDAILGLPAVPLLTYEPPEFETVVMRGAQTLLMPWQYAEFVDWLRTMAGVPLLEYEPDFRPHRRYIWGFDPARGCDRGTWTKIEKQPDGSYRFIAAGFGKMPPC